VREPLAYNERAAMVRDGRGGSARDFGRELEAKSDCARLVIA
jgi:hypothetical protein